MSNTPETPAGWYPDTNQPGTLRYWDGQRWTEHTHKQTPAGPAAAQMDYQNSGYQTYSPGMTQAPNNHLVMAILTTLFCCLPFGIVSIVKAAQVNNLWNSGQYDAARKASDDAKKWWIVSLCIGLVVLGFYLFSILALGSVETSNDF